LNWLTEIWLYLKGIEMVISFVFLILIIVYVLHSNYRTNKKWDDQHKRESERRKRERESR